MKPPYAIGSVPSLSGHAIAYRWRSLPTVRRHRASKPQGSSERVLPWQIPMDQLILASLSHTHYWYEVGMLKVPENPGKLLPSDPPLLSPFWSLLGLFGSPAMNWDHAVSWGRGVWVLSASDIGRVGRPELVVGQPELKKPRKRVSCCLAWVVVRQNHPSVVNRRAQPKRGNLRKRKI